MIKKLVTDRNVGLVLLKNGFMEPLGIKAPALEYVQAERIGLTEWTDLSYFQNGKWYSVAGELQYGRTRPWQQPHINGHLHHYVYSTDAFIYNTWMVENGELRAAYNGSVRELLPGPVPFKRFVILPDAVYGLAFTGQLYVGEWGFTVPSVRDREWKIMEGAPLISSLQVYKGRILCLTKSGYLYTTLNEDIPDYLIWKDYANDQTALNV
jgi:hypothetical protein